MNNNSCATKNFPREKIDIFKHCKILFFKTIKFKTKFRFNKYLV